MSPTVLESLEILLLLELLGLIQLTKISNWVRRVVTNSSKSAELASVVVASLGTILTGELVLSLRKKPVKVVHNRIREGTFFENSFFFEYAL
jgi:hypothetical protein